MRHDDNESQQARAVREQLVRLVQTHGPEILDDSRRVRAMLADAVAGATAETNLIGLALGSGVPARLRAAGSTPGVIETTARDLESTSSVQPADARWAVSVVADALGLTVPEPQPARPRTSPAPAVGRQDGPPSPDDLVIRVGGREHVARAGEVVTIGREPGSTLVLDSSAVSRRHARIQRGSAGWEFHDLGSTQGSFVDGVSAPSFSVSKETEVVLGQGQDKVSVRLVPFGLAATSTPNERPRPVASPAAAATEVPGARPGGALAGGAARTELGSSSRSEVITVTVGGRSRTVSPGVELSVGREDDNDLVASGTTVSRKHLRIEHRKDGWHLHDFGTTSGTWQGGTRVSDVRLSGRQEFVLGDQETGDRLVTEAPERTETGTPSWRSTPAVTGKLAAALAAAMAVVLVVAGVAWWLSRDDQGDSPPQATVLTDDQLAQGTVKLSTDQGSGSGVVIDKKQGLIVTNAHVAAPSAPGVAVNYAQFSDELGENPDELLVSVSEGLDESAEARFIAELVAVDGYLDVAVLKITKKASGALVDADDLADLTEVPLGESKGLKTSDPVKMFGYPGAADALTPTLTTGTISSPVQDERIGDSRAMLNTTATTSGGNSGGLAADSGGRMVGLHMLSRLDQERNKVFSSFRPIDLVKPVIEAARKGTPYTSKYVVAGPASAQVTDPGYARPGDPGSVAEGCTGFQRLPELLGISVRVSGFPGGRHTDVMAALIDPRSGQTVARARTSYPTTLPASGCLTLTFDREVPQGSYTLKIGVGGNYRVRFSTTYESL